MPAEFVVETMLTPVSTLVIVTVAPGTNAPVESITVPLISPVFAFCPRAKFVIRLAANNRPTRPTILKLIAEPPELNPRPDQRAKIIMDLSAQDPFDEEHSNTPTGGESYAEASNRRIRQKLD